jgi:hypothetical protein
MPRFPANANGHLGPGVRPGVEMGRVGLWIRLLRRHAYLNKPGWAASDGLQLCIAECGDRRQLVGEEMWFVWLRGRCTSSSSVTPRGLRGGKNEHSKANTQKCDPRPSACRWESPGNALGRRILLGFWMRGCIRMVQLLPAGRGSATHAFLFDERPQTRTPSTTGLNMPDPGRRVRDIKGVR